MATRLYVSSSVASPLLPAVAANWENTTPPRNGALVDTKDGSTLAAATSNTLAQTEHDILLLQAASEPLAAQTISGTVKGQFRASGAAPASARAQVVVRVLSGNGSVVRGTLLVAHTEAASSEFVSTLTNRKFPLSALSPVTLSPVVAQAGDRLVIEWGARAVDEELSEFILNLSAGAPSANDLPEDETETGALAPWIEFSADLAFEGAPTGGPGGGGIGVGVGIGL